MHVFLFLENSLSNIRLFACFSLPILNLTLFTRFYYYVYRFQSLLLSLFYSKHFTKPNFESVILLKIADSLRVLYFYKVLVIPHFSEARVFILFIIPPLQQIIMVSLPFGFTFVIFMVIIITEIVCVF